MYFWNSNALANEMSTNVLPQRERMKYLLAWTLFNTIAIQNALWTVEAVTWFTIAKALLVIAINLVGVLACFAANRRGDNTNFVERFICLGWPIIFKISVIMFIGAAALLAIKEIFDVCTVPYLESWEAGATFEVFLLTIAGEVIYFLWLRSLIVRVSAARLRA